jgi:hypothetical protein
MVCAPALKLSAPEGAQVCVPVVMRAMKLQQLLHLSSLADEAQERLLPKTHQVTLPGVGRQLIS